MTRFNNRLRNCSLSSTKKCFKADFHARVNLRKFEYAVEC